MKSRRDLLQDFLTQDPNDSFSRYALALELEKEGHSPEAVSQLEEVIRREPGYVAAYYHLGRLFAAAGRADEARDVYQRGVTVATAANDQRTRAELLQALDLL